MSSWGQALREQSQTVQAEGGASAPISVYLADPGDSGGVTKSPGCIMKPLQFHESGSPLTEPHFFNRLDGGSDGQVWADDYGEQQKATIGFTSSYRLMGMGVRVRVIGLPSGQFMTPGKIYFAQVRWHTDDVPILEEDFVQLERLGRGTHVSMDAVRASGSKTFYAVPDSADKFEMSSSFYPAPGIVNVGDFVGVGPRDDRIFTTLKWVNGAGVSNYAAICPYNVAGVPNSSTISTQDATDQQVADQTQLIVVGCFGLQDGVVLEVDYASNYEVVPTSSAPPGVETSIQLPDSLAMDEIFAGVAMAAAVRPQLLQADGDRTITDVPTSAFGDTAEARVARSRAAATKSLIGRAGALKGRQLTPARAEGFWDFDWLQTGSFGNKKTGGLSWDFHDKK